MLSNVFKKTYLVQNLLQPRNFPLPTYFKKTSACVLL
jgi:hypothetical protein